MGVKNCYTSIVTTQKTTKQVKNIMNLKWKYNETLAVTEDSDEVYTFQKGFYKLLECNRKLF